MHRLRALPWIALLLVAAPGCPGDRAADVPAEAPATAPAPGPIATPAAATPRATRAPSPAFHGAVGRQQPLSMQLHLHGSLSEFEGTMLYHTAEAEQYGVDVLWWSDHDALIQMMNRPRRFDFDDGGMGAVFETADLALEHGFSQVSDTTHDSSVQLLEGGPGGAGYYLELHADSTPDPGWRTVRYRYVGEFFGHQLPLLADATVQLAVDPVQPLTDDWQFHVVFLLSGNTGGTRNSLVYYLATDDLTALDDVDTRHIPMTAPEGVWTTWTMPLSDDAIASFPEMDDQSALETYLELHVRNGAEAAVDLDEFVRSWLVEGEKLRDKQVQVLADRYSDGGVTHFVGQEITLVDDGHHVNPLGPPVIPMPEYREIGSLGLREATDYVHDHGGIAVCNHPFGTATRVMADGDKALDRVAALLDEWLLDDGFGCDAVEVGYRARVVDLDHHLLFWDGLSEERLFVTGIGTSDHHKAQDWLSIRNPFLTWVFLDTPTEADVTAEIEAGRAFFGDPAPFVGEQPLLDLWTESGAVMGQVLRGDDPLVVHVELGYLEAGWTLALVVDGELYDAIVLDGAESELAFGIDRAHHRFVRAELWDEDDRPILISNPIYTVPEGWRGIIPPARHPAGS